MKRHSPFRPLIYLILVYGLSSCTTGLLYLRSKYSQETEINQFIDTVRVGHQLWAVRNLDVTHYRNGDAIEQAQTFSKWKSMKTGAWCYYLYNAANGLEYGKLYNWYAVNDPRGLAPEGWQIPSAEDWVLLTEQLGGKTVAGDKLKEKGRNHWAKESGGEKVNESGFTALANGFRSEFGNFYSQRNVATFWTSDKQSKKRAKFFLIDYKGDIKIKTTHKKSGYGIRVICSSNTCQPISYKFFESSIPGDSSKYETFNIGSQVWMKNNLDVDHYRNGDLIPQVQDPLEWRKLSTGAWCYSAYNYNKLYNWYAVSDPRGLAPEGWHIPSDEEWQITDKSIRTQMRPGGALNSHDQDTWHWCDGGIFNENWFHASPLGLRSDKGSTSGYGILAVFWSSSESSKSNAICRQVKYNNTTFDLRKIYGKRNGFNVRCIKDADVK